AEQALDLRKQLYGERHYHVGASLNNLALVVADQGDLPRPRQLHEQALALFKQLYGDRHPDVAAALNNLAEVCRDQGALTRARQPRPGAAPARRRPGVDHARPAAPRPETLTATADTVVRFQRLGLGLASADQDPGADRLRQASHAYALAADVL